MARFVRYIERIECMGIAAVAAALRRLSLPALQSIGKWFGIAMWSLLAKRRADTIDRIARHLPNLAGDRRAAKKLARSSWMESGRSYVEFFHAHAFNASRLGTSVRLDNPDTVARFVANQRPVVAVTAHLGSWELLTGIMGSAFADSRPRAVLVRVHKHAPIADLMTRQRRVHGVQILDKKNAAPQALHILRQNGIVAFLADLNAFRSESVFLPFLGETAAVTKGPALLALQTDALVWPVFLPRTPEGRVTHTLRIDDPLDAAALTGSVEERIMTISAFANRAIERMALEYPTQWYWLPNRWKTRPVGNDEPA